MSNLITLIITYNTYMTGTYTLPQGEKYHVRREVQQAPDAPPLPQPYGRTGCWHFYHWPGFCFLLLKYLEWELVLAHFICRAGIRFVIRFCQFRSSARHLWWLTGLYLVNGACSLFS